MGKRGPAIKKPTGPREFVYVRDEGWTGVWIIDTVRYQKNRADNEEPLFHLLTKQEEEEFKAGKKLEEFRDAKNAEAEAALAEAMAGPSILGEVDEPDEEPQDEPEEVEIPKTTRTRKKTTAKK